MNNKELEKEATEFEANYTVYEVAKGENGTDYAKKKCNVTLKEAYIAGAEPREKRIAELEQKISVLLSCKDCPENKGGYICEKEYEGKCLAQKIQYIKELQEENENFRKTAAHQQTQNMERYFENERTKKTALLNLDGWRKSDAKLEKARALLAQWAQTSFAGACDNVNLAAETEQFLAGDL